ncbi:MULTISPECIES: bifunctional 4-hydroxy-2-oxoglutarate aldolase/2-dehydro-3-deoxy-phosphogluconate aldolase [Chryseobacterium]|uniref:2-dehydro-3-deoxyphosphogluconate aldolase/(4S)-4-hydroxy-2-oxoglutarate aldolase n=1 Tax=Chryseobacterium camelliae TaxID=1265445 RepID=A0ABU0TGA3_9FLAO|nr:MULTISPECIES: bifunctional 4-hydroxy-2-oxoglutarate aldolase/2-dehydro-3-deoxy-phosphogluconate aldolase [Chryseobacterium]MDT3406134.1 2-dehydro-3-deoxyphosphogluconate aldolase/(4S)-4-hydroxy-2-oxoglutarate aldolase [Pseudacidovorax intermedius]MDQ1096062.1 2-dehydro-3-deoxyphosphogluconate aldolase/(4S)-4-hydroxy-2-oxoglutarate aldolase [Chryseobacterium camelliae]MDQ1099999.1 2-dehydro-3-deoxyphosphogluconate aldolase/(4S)-4-hydroxy-2-oxoglutarate aldolase [Chryseobacterium sp. SORGH_AS_1
MNLSVIQQIKNQKIVPLFYNESFEVSENIIKALYKVGIRAIEYTNRGSQALENFTRLKEISAVEFPELLLGIGTVKNTKELDDYADVKADFIITPVISEELVKKASERNILLIPGCFTPSDVNVAFQNGLTMVKIFPADALGKNYIKSIRPVFPGMNFMPTGGVHADAEDINEWFKGGAAAVGLGSSLIQADFSAEQLTEKVKDLLEQLNQN